MERLTIDEAIQRENKIAEENQKIVDTEIVFDDVSLSKLYCDDTEVIEEHLENYKKCVEYHKQIVEWLEELKDHRERECNHINEALYDKGYSDGYNKAIDDFAKEVKEAIDIRLEQVSHISDVGSNMCTFYAIVDEIAEQLKVGGENESK